MSSEFDRALAVSPRPGDPATVDAHLDGGWQIGNGINGGMLLALAAHGLGRRCGQDGHPDPVSLSGYYLSAATSGPATVRTDLVRRGRSMTTGAVALAQRTPGGAVVERVRALGTFGDLDALPDDVRTTAKPPAIPPPEECLVQRDAPADLVRSVPLLERLDLRHDPATAGWASGRPSHQGVLRAWFRLADGREPDPLVLLLAVDALPPVTFDLGLGGWAPTLELTAHVRARPAPGWLLVSHATRNFAGGMFEEDAEVWDSAGRLVAQSRQLARAPRGAAG